MLCTPRVQLFPSRFGSTMFTVTAHSSKAAADRVLLPATCRPPGMVRSPRIARGARSKLLCNVIAASLLYGGMQLARQAKNAAGDVFVLPPRAGPATINFHAPEGSTIASTANLAKSIVGAGVLSLPCGAAKVFDAAEQGGYDHVSSIAFLLLLYAVFGGLNAGGFYLIGEVCERTGARTYQEAWNKTLGDRLEWLPSAASLVCSFTGMVACISVLGDTTSELASFLSQAFVAKEILISGISTFVLFPLCMLPSLSPLAFASVLGLAGVCILAFVMTIRYLDGSYAPGGAFYSDARAAVDGLSQVAIHGTGDSLQGVFFQQLIIFAAVLSNAFTAHFNAPAIFNELEPRINASGTSSRLPEFTVVTLAAFLLSGLVFSTITIAGVETFGISGGPSILTSYSSADPLTWVAKIGLGLCVLFEFPLLERCFRKTVVELFKVPEVVEQNSVTVVASIAAAVALACMPNFGLDKSSAIGGALGASFLVYVAPALMALQLRKAESGASGAEDAEDADAEARKMLLRGVAALGSVLGGLGMAEAMQP